jgi:hypothetical protein
MDDLRFPEEAWVEIFSTVPAYPRDLSDDLVRAIADLAIHARGLAESLPSALADGDHLAAWMEPTLTRGALQRVDEGIAKALNEKSVE